MNRSAEICSADQACVLLLQNGSPAPGPHALPQGGRHGSGREAPAARRIRLSEIPSNKHASALLGLRVMGDKPKPTLTLVAKSFELSYQVVGASCEVLERYDDDTALLIAPDEAGLLEFRQQRRTNPQW